MKATQAGRSRKPVSLEDLTAAGGIALKLVDFAADMAAADPKAGAAISKNCGGVCVQDGRDLTIILNTRRRGARRRFVHAHELAHAATAISGQPLSQGLAATDGTIVRNAALEAIADRVASEVLMPADLVLLEVFRSKGTDELKLAAHFGVSLMAMRSRLADLGLMRPE